MKKSKDTLTLNKTMSGEISQQTTHNKNYKYLKNTLFYFAILNIVFNVASANIFADTFSKLKKTFINKDNISSSGTEQELEEPVLRANYKYDILTNGNNIKVKVDPDNNNKVIPLTAEVGPMRTSTDEELVDGENIQIYEVKEGDTLSSISKIYGVSPNTIVWANDIKNGRAKVGEVLIILPVSGVRHTIKKGDTVKTIAKKYSADILDIIEFNNIKEGDALAVGDDIIIPDGKMTFDAPAPKKQNVKKRIYPSTPSGYYVRPIIGGVKTQGIHGKNAVDIAAPVGTPILASAGGTVQVARNSGYNGGYGRMIIISHGNGTQSVYAHMNNVYVTSGQAVSQGEQIGESGNSGKSTGPHLHFEIRGAENPF